MNTHEYTHIHTQTHTHTHTCVPSALPAAAASKWVSPIFDAITVQSRLPVHIRHYTLLQSVATCCSVFQCDAVRCSVLQCVAVCCSVSQFVFFVSCIVLQCESDFRCHHHAVKIACTDMTLQCVEERCNVLQCVTVRCNVLQCDALCCSEDLIFEAITVQSRLSGHIRRCCVLQALQCVAGVAVCCRRCSVLQALQCVAGVAVC